MNEPSVPFPDRGDNFVTVCQLWVLPWDELADEVRVGIVEAIHEDEHDDARN